MNSRRICGLARQIVLEKKRSNQKSPLTVRMVTALEYFTAGEENLARDRVAAGCLLCIYLHSDEVFVYAGTKDDAVANGSSCDWFKHWQVASIWRETWRRVALVPAPCRGGWARVPFQLMKEPFG